MKRIITYCLLLTLFVGCKDAFVSWNGVVENEIDFSGFFGKDGGSIQMPKNGEVAIKTFMQNDKASLCVSFSDKEKMEFYSFYLKDLPVNSNENELSFSSKTPSVTCVKEVFRDDVGLVEQYVGQRRENCFESESTESCRRSGSSVDAFLNRLLILIFVFIVTVVEVFI